MVNYLEQIAQFEAEIKKTPYNKRTQGHIGLVKAKIARLREAQEKRSASKGGGQGYAVRKSGDATVVLLGYPSVGKSTLINQLTNAESKIAPYAFTTVSVIPGMMKYNGAYIQILDLPGIIERASHGKGRGREVLSVVRNAELILIMTEVGREGDFAMIEHELKAVGILLNATGYDTRIYESIPALYLINKIDREPVLRFGGSDMPKDPHVLYISAENKTNLDRLKEMIWS